MNKKLNNQELFNLVARHLMVQGKRSGEMILGSDGKETFNCYYRAPNGCRCAAGAILPDNLYSPRMEGLSVRGEVCCTVFYKLVEDLDLLSHLQEVHDFDFGHFVGESPQSVVGDLLESKDCREIWKTRLAVLAENYQLDASVLEEPIPA